MRICATSPPCIMAATIGHMSYEELRVHSVGQVACVAAGGEAYGAIIALCRDGHLVRFTLNADRACVTLGVNGVYDGSCMSLHPTLSRVAIALANPWRVELWDLVANRRLGQTVPLKQPVTDLHWSHSGKYIAALEGAHVLRVWDMETFKHVKDGYDRADARDTKITWVAGAEGFDAVFTAHRLGNVITVDALYIGVEQQPPPPTDGEQ